MTAKNGKAMGKIAHRFRCAIYTRKSNEDGLEQEFNSLDAQREAGEAFVKSQAQEGWECLPDDYVDWLPPGQQCAETDEDVRALAVFMRAIEQAQAMDRSGVRYRAVDQFDTDRIIDDVITAINAVRLSGGQGSHQSGRQTPERATEAG